MHAACWGRPVRVSGNNDEECSVVCRGADGWGMDGIGADSPAPPVYITRGECVQPPGSTSATEPRMGDIDAELPPTVVNVFCTVYDLLW